MSSGNTYYYKCGTKQDTREIHCTKSETGYKDFDVPSDYVKITLFAVNKATADKCLLGESKAPSIVGTLASFANAETGEAKILTSELGTSAYIILDK